MQKNQNYFEKITRRRASHKTNQPASVVTSASVKVSLPPEGEIW